MLRKHPITLVCDDAYPYTEKRYAWYFSVNGVGTKLAFCTDLDFTPAEAMQKLLDRPPTD
jgi:hypothetical protein